ncbi:hypothetical protein HID58_014595 [Brassica napus]|uniref:Leucine-rich repeat-containing N-terminal plant-type domain-containing protein n=1 Tax=Brassica napus TaxID=3708 RepID=A0ABQ8DJF2_BRANA|nr:hypothetical protein HID58_014595 [Brassica napus]
MPSFSERTMMIWSLCLIISLSNRILVIASSSRHLCRPYQKDALLEFKNEFHYNVMAGKTESWRNNTDCCSWKGISCDPKTGNVVELDLQDSFLNGPLRSNSSLFRLQHLQTLDLGLNNLTGILPASISNLKYLRNLTLYNCNLFGKIPSSLGNLSYLTDLDLSVNDFNGELPGSVGYLNRLTELRLVSANLTSLVSLDLSFWNTRRGNVDFTIFLHLKSLKLLHLSNMNTKTMVDLSLLSHLMSLVSLMYFSCSDNRFPGEISREICKLVYLDTLVLSNNNFNGSIPRCFEYFNTTLSVLNLRNNSISGVFPAESICVYLRSLDVGHNKISGELPKSLINCTRLEFLNVEDNMFNDKFPFWLRLLPNLQILVLRSNHFHGKIFSSGASLIFPKLRIFDISRNLFTGVLPSDYFAGWSAMSSDVGIVDSTPDRILGRGSGFYHRSVALTNKGLNMELVGSGFKIYKSIDVSGNRIEGDIPTSIGLLKELIVLNMSNNVFTGGIPPSLASLTNLQSLDLSQNRLSGEIPPELGKLTFLARMNFSYNMLEGPIPQGTQIQSQNSSSFGENPGLCGFPLEETCGGNEEEATKKEEDEEKEEKDQVISWISAAIGYVPGVLGGLAIGHILHSYKFGCQVKKGTDIYMNLGHGMEWRRMIRSLCFIFSLYASVLVFASHAAHLCRPDQKDALWEFKSEFYVDGLHSDGTPVDKKTERWKNNIDCCSWDGISCDPKTGKVVELDLTDSFLNGPLRSNSILPDSVSNLKYLRVLSLGGCSFYGQIPSSLGNLSYLTNLDLSHNEFIGELPDSMGNLKKLTDLGLDHNKISGNFPHVLLNMSELTQIDIGSNQFEGMLPSNMSSLSKLVYFDINENSFYGSIPPSLFMIPSLIQLYMGRNSFSGPLEIGNISSLSPLGFLALGDNNFNGPIPRFITKLVGLWYLDLALWNTEKGKVDFSIFLHLESLTFLDLSYINTRSRVDLSLFSDLMSLGYLDLSGINLKISPTLHLLSPIEILTLSSCNIAEFPKFLETQTSLSYLDISANQIKGQVPKWLWRLPLLRIPSLVLKDQRTLFNEVKFYFLI